jgi:hypothetical protein
LPVRNFTQAAEPREEPPQFPVDLLPIGVKGAIQKVGPGRCRSPTIRIRHRDGKRGRLIAIEVMSLL